MNRIAILAFALAFVASAAFSQTVGPPSSSSNPYLVVDFVDLREYSAVCDYGTNGTAHDISTVVNQASIGIQSLGLPIFFPPNCNMNNELQVLAQNQTWFGPQHQPTYSKFNIAQPYVHVNTGNIQAGSEDCVIELNSHQGFTRRSLVFFGDSSSHETTGLCTNTNTNNADGSLQAPVIDDRDVAVLNMGNFIGCPSNATGAAPTGTLCGNVMLYRGDRVISGYNQNDFTGNLSDLHLSNFIAESTECDSIWLDQSSAPPSANITGYSRIEGEGSTFCPNGTGGDAVHINGAQWTISGLQIESWGGNGYILDGSYSQDSIIGGFVHNVGGSATAKHQAIVAFNGGNSGINKGVKITGVIGRQTGSGNRQLYWIDWEGTNDGPVDFIGNGMGSQSYTTSLMNTESGASAPSFYNLISADEPSASQLFLGTLQLNSTPGADYITLASGNLAVVHGFSYVAQFLATSSSQNWLTFKGSADSSTAAVAIGCAGNSTNCGVNLVTVGNGGIGMGSTRTPADNSACNAGTEWWDTSFIYLCTASGTVKRATLSTY